jgi:hypothetical protein
MPGKHGKPPEDTDTVARLYNYQTDPNAASMPPEHFNVPGTLEARRDASWIWKTIAAIFILLLVGAGGYYWGHHAKDESAICKQLVNLGPYTASGHHIPYYQYLASLRIEQC